MESTHSVKDFINAKPFDRNSDGTVSCGLLSLSPVQYKLCPESFKTKCIVDKPVISSQFFHTVNQDIYKGVLQCLRESVQHCCPELWTTGKWFFLHNAQPLMVLSNKEFFSVHQITILPHTHYFPYVTLQFFSLP
jgi:hypothetical protein